MSGVRCKFYKYEPSHGDYTEGCGQYAHIEILMDNFVADATGTRITGHSWVPYCWECLMDTVMNPEAIKQDGIRRINTHLSKKTRRQLYEIEADQPMVVRPRIPADGIDPYERS